MVGGLDALIKHVRKHEGGKRRPSVNASTRICGIKGQFPRLPTTQVSPKPFGEGLIPSKVKAPILQKRHSCHKLDTNKVFSQEAIVKAFSSIPVSYPGSPA